MDTLDKPHADDKSYYLNQLNSQFRLVKEHYDLYSGIAGNLGFLVEGFEAGPYWDRLVKSEDQYAAMDQVSKDLFEKTKSFMTAVLNEVTQNISEKKQVFEQQIYPYLKRPEMDGCLTLRELEDSIAVYKSIWKNIQGHQCPTENYIDGFDWRHQFKEALVNSRCALRDLKCSAARRFSQRMATPLRKESNTADGHFKPRPSGPSG